MDSVMRHRGRSEAQPVDTDTVFICKPCKGGIMLQRVVPAVRATVETWRAASLHRLSAFSEKGSEGSATLSEHSETITEGSATLSEHPETFTEGSAGLSEHPETSVEGSAGLSGCSAACVRLSPTRDSKNKYCFVHFF
jgi:hypothetical protein